MFKLFRLARFGTHAPKETSHTGHSHDSHSHPVHSSDPHHSDPHHSSHELGDHGHVSHSSHKKIPAGSWHRHSDDEDPYYYYDRYGPFHTYSFLGFGKPDYPDETPDDEIYRYEIQGYIRMVDVDDNRKNIQRGYFEFIIASTFLLVGIGIVTKRTNFDDDNVEKKLGDALITAQEIEGFIEKAKERLA